MNEVVSLSYSRAGIDRDALFDIWEKYGEGVLHTSFGWVLKKVMKDLYDFDKVLNRKNLIEFCDIYIEKHRDEDWPLAILDKAKIEKLFSSTINESSYWNLKKLTLKDSVFTRKFIHTLERAGTSDECKPFWRLFLYFKEKEGHDLTSMSQLREFIRKNEKAPVDFHVFVSWISSFSDFKEVNDCVLDKIILKISSGKAVDNTESGILNGALLRFYLELFKDKIKICQLCYGTQYFHSDGRKSNPLQRAANAFGSELGYLLQEFPDIHFNILNGYEPDEPILASLTQGFANVSLGGWWWHTFYPSVMQHNWQRRFDMVPVNSLMGFFSDGYCAEWVYGRAFMTRRVLANTFAQRILNGFCDFDEALVMSEKILYETPMKIMIK